MPPCLHVSTSAHVSQGKTRKWDSYTEAEGKREGNYPALVSDKYAIAEIAAVFVVGSRVGASRDPVLP